MTHAACADLTERAAAATAYLGPGSVRRLCIDLIASEQDRLIREKRLSPREHITRLPASTDPRLPIEIGEEDLGLDSLARLDLVGSVSRFFCLADSGAEDLLLIHRDLDDWVRIVGAHLERLGPTARFGFETSGSRGKPKRVVHDGQDLDAEVREILSVILAVQQLRIQWPARIVTAVPPRHIYGFLWSALLPERAGLQVLELHRSSGEALFRHCLPGDVVIGTPFTWERAAGLGSPLPSGITGITSGAPSTTETWEAAASLRLDRLIEVYGSTETGGLGWRTSSETPFRLSGRVDRRGQEVWRRSCGSEVALQDHLVWRGPDRFDITGRLDDVVQVAGTNVSLEEVVRVLCAVDGVAEATVRLHEGRIRALIVPDASGRSIEQLENAVRACVMRSLDPPARPDRFLFAPALPRTAMGKPAHW